MLSLCLKLINCDLLINNVGKTVKGIFPAPEAFPHSHKRSDKTLFFFFNLQNLDLCISIFWMTFDFTKYV